MRKRPISVLIFGILNIMFALFAFIGVLVSIALRNSPASANTLRLMNSNPAFAAWSHVATVYSCVAGVALVAAGIGLLLLQNWARVLSLVYAGVEIVYVFVSAYFSHFVFNSAAGQMHSQVSPQLMMAFMVIGLIIGIILQLAYPVLLLIFLNLPKARQAFAPEQPLAVA